jgi:hypothetical protein
MSCFCVTSFSHRQRLFPHRNYQVASFCLCNVFFCIGGHVCVFFSRAFNIACATQKDVRMCRRV